MSFALSVVIKTSIVLLCGAALASALPRASAATRHAVWALALGGVLVLPLLSWSLPALDVVLPSAPSAASAGEIHDRPQCTDCDIAAAGRPPLPAIAREAATPWNWAAIVWCAGFLISLSQLALGMRAIRTLARKARAVSDPGLSGILESLCSRLSVKRPVRLVSSDAAITPMTWGVRSPVILLPAGAAEWSVDRIRLVLAHELAHVQRGDGLLQILIHALCSVYWFNPLVWFAAHRLRIERERACDDQVLNLGARPNDYAEHLLQIARAVRPERKWSFAAVSMAHRSQLETRLLAILDSGIRRHSPRRLATAALFAAILTFTLPVAALRLTAQSAAPPGAESREKLNAPRAQSSAPQSSAGRTRQDAETGKSEPAPGQAKSDLEAAAKALQAERAEQERRLAELELRREVERQQESWAQAQARARIEEERLFEELSALAARENAENAERYRAVQQAYEDAVRHSGQLQHSNPHVDRIIQPLIETLKDESEDVRTEAVKSLAELRDTRAFEPLMGALKDPSEDVRSAAAIGLGRLWDSRAIDALTSALKDPSPDVRRWATWALGQIARHRDH